MSNEAQPANDGSDGLQSLALSLLGDKATDRVKKILTTYVIFTTAYRLGYSWFVKGRSELTYQVTVNGDDPIYPSVHRWLLQQLPPKRRRALIARSEREHHVRPGHDAVETKGSLRFFFDGDRAQTFKLGKHRVRVVRHREEWSRGNGLVQESGSQMEIKYERIEFTVFGESGRDAVLRFIEQISADHYSEDRSPMLWIANRWGSWDTRELEDRTLDQIFLADDQKERVTADLGSFLQQEHDYARLGLPWHRGYMFEGPPGTGKTSFARALANHFKLDVYYIPLADMKGDSNLLQLIAAIHSQSMLLLEDIDVFHATLARESDDSDGDRDGLTLSGVLNSLDGVATPHGLVFVATSNRPQVLDDALMRRFEVIETLGFIEQDQLDRLVGAFVGYEVDLPDPPADLTPDKVVGALKKHLRDPEAGLAAVKALL